MAEIKIGSKVTDNPATNHCGEVIETRYDESKGEFQAYVRWHKGYSSWNSFSQLTIKD